MKHLSRHLFSTLLLAALLLSLCACQRPTPAEELNHFCESQFRGETFLILDDDYGGEHDIQTVLFEVPEFEQHDSSLDDFVFTGVMDEAQYTAFCAKWGIEQVYHNKAHYAIETGLVDWSDEADVRLGGVHFDKDSGEMTLYRRAYFQNYNPTAAIGYFLVVPTSEKVQSVSCVELYLPYEVRMMIDTPVAEKPILYLYPTEETELTVKLGHPERLSCVYPAYRDGWHILAQPDGTLTDLSTGRSLYALYWEGKHTELSMTQEGFVVAGVNTATFLEEKLAILGLSEREAEEMIVYWLPRMEDNAYNYIRFASAEELEDYMPLSFSEQPDSIIRVAMVWKALDTPIAVKEQTLETPNRTGFVAVEWGGIELQ